jgi:hypothetical protein
VRRELYKKTNYTWTWKNGIILVEREGEERRKRKQTIKKHSEHSAKYNK